MADNWKLDITNEGIERLKLAMKIAFSAQPKATHYCDHPVHGLVLLWSSTKEVDGQPVIKLPFVLLNSDMAAEFAWNWLQSASYGEEPDIDGSCKKGWRLYNEEWGHVGESPYAFVAVQPSWSYYGK